MTRPATSSPPPAPMLALTFGGAIDYPVFAQPKLNGIRCLATSTGLWTRTGKPIETQPHIAFMLVRVFDTHPLAVLDGELYNHDFRDNLAATLSAFQRRDRPSPLEFHVFDIASERGMTFAERHHDLAAILEPCQAPVFAVPTEYITSRAALDGHYRRQIGTGYEGQMLRRADMQYEAKRSIGLLKRKTFHDADDLARIAA